MTTSKPPKRRIVKTWALLDEALAIWQADVRDWYKAQAGVDDVTDDLLHVVNVLREMRMEVESS